MKNVIASLKSGSQGKEVKNVNNCLAFLLEKGSGIIDMNPVDAASDVIELKDLITWDIERYGAVTQSLIFTFQKNQQLPETGEVDEETAKKLNSVLNNVGAFDQQLHSGSNGHGLNNLAGYTPNRNVVGPEVLQRAQEIISRLKKAEINNESCSSHLLRLSIRDGEYTYAKADDIIMIESSDHLSIVHVAQQIGKVKTTLRSSSLKEFLLTLPKNCFLRANRFCAVNLNRLSGGSYHQQFFEFDHSIRLKPKHRLSHAVFNSIGK